MPVSRCGYDGMAIKVILLLLLAGISFDQYSLAQMLDGEAYDCTDSFCHEAATSLIDTVYNRLYRGWCYTVQECLEAGYWGYLEAPEIPSAWAVEAVMDYQRQNRDIVFAFSGRDCDRLQLDRDLALVEAGPFFFYGNEIDLSGESHRGDP